MIEALDAETNAFHATVAAVYQSLHDIDFDQLYLAQNRTNARVQMVRVHPLCSPELDHAAVNAMKSFDVVRKAVRGEPTDASHGRDWKEFRIQARKVFDSQAEKGSELLEDIREARKIRWSTIIPRVGKTVGSKRSTDSSRDGG